MAVEQPRRTSRGRTRGRRAANVELDERRHAILRQLRALQETDQEGSKEWTQLQEQLVEATLPLAMWLMKHREFGILRTESEHEADIKQTAKLAILDAAKYYLHTPQGEEENFSGYVSDRVHHEAEDYRNSNFYINIPEQAKRSARRLRRAIYPLYKELGKRPTLDQVAEYTGLPAEEVVELLKLLPDHYRETIASQRGDGLSSRDAFGELRNHRGQHSPKQRAVLEGYIANLADRDKEILLLHFEDLPEAERAQKLAALAKKYNLKERGVKRIALRTLRELYAAHPDIKPRGLTPRRQHQRQVTAAITAQSDSPGETSVETAETPVEVAQPEVTSPALVIPTTLVAASRIPVSPNETVSPLAARLQGEERNTKLWRITGVLTEEDSAVPAPLGAAVFGAFGDGPTRRVPRATLGETPTVPIHRVAIPVMTPPPLRIPPLGSPPPAHFSAPHGYPGHFQQPPPPLRPFPPAVRPPAAAQPPVPGPRVNPASPPLRPGSEPQRPNGFAAGVRRLFKKLRGKS